MDEWIYPPINKILEKVLLWTTNKFIRKCQNIVADYVPMRPIFELFSKAECPNISQSRRRVGDQIEKFSKGEMDEVEG